MDQGPGDQGRPLASSTTSTNTTSAPYTTTTTTSTTPGQGITVQHFGPQSTTITHPAVTTTTRSPSTQPSTAQLYASPSNPAQRVRSSSIRIRRPTQQPGVNTPQPTPDPAPVLQSDSTWQAGRRRSSSEPRPPPQAMVEDDGIRRQLTGPHLQPLYEDGARAANTTTGNGPPPSQGPSNARRGVTRQSSAFHMRRNQKTPNQNMMGNNVVDVLDVIGQYTQ
jgi:hypothetical protein